MFFDLQGLAFTLPGVAVVLWAQWKVKSTFSTYSRVGVASGMSGAQAAAAVLRAGGVEGVSIQRHEGFLSDHYDPSEKTLNLSPDVYDGRSISSIAVAAHEAGHAIQDKVGYSPLAIRSQLVPMTNIGSRIWWLPFVIGMWARLPWMMWAGIVCFSALVLFQLVTLPTEFNASSRAKAVLAASGIVRTQEEAQGVSKVLGAAAMTYVAATFAAILQLIDLVLRAQDRRS